MSLLRLRLLWAFVWQKPVVMIFKKTGDVVICSGDFMQGRLLAYPYGFPSIETAVCAPDGTVENSDGCGVISKSWKPVNERAARFYQGARVHP